MLKNGLVEKMVNYSKLSHEEKIINSEDYIKRIIKMLGEKGITLNQGSKILEIGCGSGIGVYSYRKLNYRAYGVDFTCEYGEFEKKIFDEALDLGDNEIFFKINENNNYKLPFKDNFFDFCSSRAVFEHVMNYEKTIKEIKRVLKKGGYSFHNFVSKYKMIEDHVYVPFASIYHGYYYLLFWALLGIRNEFQIGKSAQEVAQRNYQYLENSTNYLSKREIEAIIKCEFTDYSFENFDKKLLNFYPFLDTFGYRYLFFRK
jgi:ubiquinone/menaquinone biosynthesis C-methylase UbiE